MNEDDAVEANKILQLMRVKLNEAYKENNMQAGKFDVNDLGVVYFDSEDQLTSDVVKPKYIKE